MAGETREGEARKKGGKRDAAPPAGEPTETVTRAGASDLERTADVERTASASARPEKTVASGKARPEKTVASAKGAVKAPPERTAAAGKAAKEVVLRGHTRPIGRLAWSPDGKRIATPSLDGTVRIWDAETGEQDGVSVKQRAAMFCCAWSPDGLFIATGGADKRTRIFNSTSGKQVASLSGHKGTVYGVKWSPDGDHFVSVGRDRKLLQYSPRDWKLVHEWDMFDDVMRCVAWYPDSKALCVGDDGAYLYCLRLGRNISSGRQVHSEWLADVAVNPTGRYVASAGGDRRVAISQPLELQRLWQ